ncbi:glycerol-3-phosphate ABC transporter permease [Actinocatenispora thailandica]|uniref:Glycerol-3-phosphate ABC transporter permease n=1 Tax=Actinocatenispora thailandica TaxID=227318 RepID=A0A7R7DJG1_9ACTN|nr:glycerol-3-phosphate ABC transporter permease [Actinocatenispora thailandica]
MRAETSTRPNPAGRTAVRKILLYAALVLIAAVFVMPLYWLFSSAVKPSGEIYQFPLQWIPRQLHWSNFTNAWHDAPFGSFFVNSIIVTVVGTVIKMVLATGSAYAFTFLPFPFKRFIFLLLLGTLMTPGTITLLTNYLTASDLGWVDTYAGLIVPGAGSAFGMFLLRQQMMALPREVFEAARVDGASHLRILLRMVVPMSRPMMITVSLISVIEVWNDFIWPLIITTTTEMRTLPIGLLYLKSQEGYNDWGAIMAGTVMVAAPMLVVFLLAQRYIVAGFSGGAIKG